jgi:ABC-type methionine transport system ATPase subunit
MKTFRTTVILVTHNFFQARRLSDEVLFLYQGKLVEKQTVDIMFSRPESELTRQFISGTMIFWGRIIYEKKVYHYGFIFSYIDGRTGFGCRKN